MKQDAVLAAAAAGQLRPIAKKGISEFRKEFMRDNHIRDQLNYGRKPAGTTKELEQYLYSYGKMVASSWTMLSQNKRIRETLHRFSPTHLYDHGCGQGLGVIGLREHFGKDILGGLKQIHLRDQSNLALQRAESVAKALAKNADITAAQVDLTSDSKPKKEVRKSHSWGRHLHILSWSLDLRGFCLDGLKAFTTKLEGDHLILATSVSRGFNGGTQNFQLMAAWAKLRGKLSTSLEATVHLQTVEDPNYSHSLDQLLIEFRT